MTQSAGIADDPTLRAVTSGPPPGGERPQYKRYRARPKWLSRAPGGGDALGALRKREDEQERGAGPQGGGRRPGPSGPRPRRSLNVPGLKQPITWRRVLKWTAIGLAGWIGL